MHPDERRRGIGRRLVQILEERLRTRGCPKVNLIVWEEDQRALAFWSAAGYARAKTVELEKVIR
ncbi:hypothetical protein BH18CHL2_BH18CHL2_02250 [soil metagenome]